MFKQVFLVIIALFTISNVLAVGLIPPENTFKVDEGKTATYEFLVKGGSVAQNITVFFKSTEPNHLLIHGNQIWNISLIIGMNELKTVTARFDGIQDDSSVKVDWGFRIPSSGGGTLGFEQVTQDSFIVKVNNVVSSNSSSNTSNTGNTGSSSGSSSSGKSGGGSSIKLAVGGTVTNTTVNGSSNGSSSSGDFPEQDSAVMKDIAGEGSSLAQGIVNVNNNNVPSITITKNEGPDESNQSTNKVDLEKIIGAGITLGLFVIGILLISISSNLRSNVYK